MSEVKFAEGSLDQSARAAEISNMIVSENRGDPQKCMWLAEIVMQNICISVACSMGPPGEQKGIDFINHMYDAMGKTALMRWNLPQTRKDFDAKVLAEKNITDHKS